MRSVWLALLCAMALVGCAGKSTNPAPQAWLKPGVKVTLPPPGISTPFTEQQLLTGQFKGRQQALMVLLSADQQKISLVGLSSLGIRLFRVTYDGRGIHSEQSIALPDMPPASQVLADIMLSRWPVSAWRAALPPGWTLDDQPLRRQLRDKQGALIADIHYLMRGEQRQPVSIHQLAFGYLITIQTLDN